MAKSWIEDRWLTQDATPAEKRSLNGARDPHTARVRPEHRKSAYGTGRRYTVYWMEPLPDGRLKRRNRRFDRKDDAEAWRTQVDDDMRSGRYVDKTSAKRTFDTFADTWMLGRTDLRPSSRDTYQSHLDSILLPQWGGTPVNAITRQTIERWAGARLASLHAKTIEQIHFLFAAILELAVEQHCLTVNPARKAHWPAGQPTQRRAYLTAHQVERLADAMDLLALQPKRGSMGGDGTLILFLAYTGLRIGEALALDVRDWDREHRLIHVSKTTTGSSSATVGPTKTGRIRNVPTPAFLTDRLLMLTLGRQGDEPLFRNTRGRRICYAIWRPRFHAAVSAAGLQDIPYLTIHSLRHTYASMLIGHNTDVKTVQRLMGHASAAMTLDVYADLWPGNETAAAGVLDKVRAGARAATN